MKASSAKLAWEVVVGLEVHVQLSATRKLFSGAPTKPIHAPPNSNVSAFDMASPGSLPIVIFSFSIKL